MDNHHTIHYPKNSIFKKTIKRDIMILIKSLLLLLSLLYPVIQANNRCTVIDKQSREPIPYAVVLIYHSGKPDGLYCNMNGTFEIKNSDGIDSCRISCIGYSSVVLKNIDGNKSIIELAPLSYELKEVVIKGSDNKRETKGFNNGIMGGTTCATNGIEFAQFIKTQTLKNGFIEKVYFTVNTASYNKINEIDTSIYAFRVHIYEYEPVQKMPGKELIEDNIITHLEPGNYRNQKIFVDLRKYDLKLPADGVFIGFEYMVGYSDDKTGRKYDQLCVSHINGRGYPTFERWRLKNLDWLNLDKEISADGNLLDFEFCFGLTYRYSKN
jgi:hypothetical protein